MNINKFWDQLVCAVCRPPRDSDYSDRDLVGGQRAAFELRSSSGNRKSYYRQDLHIVNKRGQKLYCSHYRPCIVTSMDGRLPCVIYCHSNAGSRRDAEEILFTLLPKGITVFCLDFAGSGLSEGDWVTLGCHEVEDVEAAVEYLRNEGSTSTLALWGRSMGAVTAILYSQRDPSVAAVVADSPFSSLIDLMMELATNPDAEGGMSIPKPLAKMAMSMMRRSVRRKAGFSIDNVCPVDIVPGCYVPTLFGHGADDTFVPSHHSERLFVAHGAETKNYVAFEGEHNGVRPEFFYDSALIFLLGALRVDELVGPDIDLRELDANAAVLPHLSSASENSIYVAGATRRHTPRSVPWDLSAAARGRQPSASSPPQPPPPPHFQHQHGFEQSDGAGEHWRGMRAKDRNGARHDEACVDVDVDVDVDGMDEDAMLQKALEWSIIDARRKSLQVAIEAAEAEAQTHGTDAAPRTSDATESERAAGGAVREVDSGGDKHERDVFGRDDVLDLDEEEQLAMALEESLRIAESLKAAETLSGGKDETGNDVMLSICTNENDSGGAAAAALSRSLPACHDGTAGGGCYEDGTSKAVHSQREHGATMACHQNVARRHAKNEADAVRAPSTKLHDALEEQIVGACGGGERYGR